MSLTPGPLARACRLPNPLTPYTKAQKNLFRLPQMGHPQAFKEAHFLLSADNEKAKVGKHNLNFDRFFGRKSDTPQWKIFTA